jgi:hypothetical protein
MHHFWVFAGFCILHLRACVCVCVCFERYQFLSSHNHKEDLIANGVDRPLILILNFWTRAKG